MRQKKGGKDVVFQIEGLHFLPASVCIAHHVLTISLIIRFINNAAFSRIHKDYYIAISNDSFVWGLFGGLLI